MHGLYAIIDPQSCPGDALRLAKQVLLGGCAALQLRDKHSDDAAFLSRAQALSQLCRAANTPFFVNDRYWLAATAHAQGVHIGQNDASLPQVRQALGRGYLIGVSTHDLAQAQRAARAGADLIGFGPVFATSTKLPAQPAVGVSALAEVCGRVEIPVVAIGGLTLERAASIAHSGARMGAVISALCTATDPRATAQRFHAALSARQCDTT